MGGLEYTLLILLLILFLGILVPSLVRPLRFPFVSILFLISAIVGPHRLALTEGNVIIEFFGFLGFTFLMFMAGLETDLDTV